MQKFSGYQGKMQESQELFPGLWYLVSRIAEEGWSWEQRWAGPGGGQEYRRASEDGGGANPYSKDGQEMVGLYKEEVLDTLQDGGGMKESGKEVCSSSFGNTGSNKNGQINSILILLYLCFLTFIFPVPAAPI